MEEVKTPILPKINQGFRVGGIQAEREPPDRSWARIRTYLIDNPKDDNLKRRQEIWNYQQKNRGVVKSLMKSIPDIPYRVKKPTMNKWKKTPRNSHQELNHLGSDAENGLHGVHLPRIQRQRESPNRKPMLSQSSPSMERKESKTQDENGHQRLVFKYKGPDGVPVYEVEGGAMHPKFPRLPDSVLREKENGSSFSNHKKVSFSLNDLSSIGKRVEIRPSSGSSSGSSVISDGALGSYGPSSHHVGPDAPRSVWDFLSGNQFGDARTFGAGLYTKNKPTEPNKNGTVRETQSDREWFEKVIGDKEVINTTNYENFARTKPISDNFGHGPPPPRRLPPNELALLKNKIPNNINGNSVPRKPLPLVQSSPRSQIGLNIASKSPLISPTGGSSYFPIFTRDGSPMRKIGGTKKPKLNSLAPVRPPPNMMASKSNTAE